MSSIAAAAIAAFTLLQPPSRLSLFTYSRDSAAGFKDEALDAFRRELGKQVESFTEVAYSRDEAQVSVQFLGQGDLTLELADGGDSVRYLWRFDEAAPRTWALVRVGEFVKEFSIDGRGARDLSRLAKAIADWIRDNSAAIRAFRARSRGSSHGDASLCPQVPAGGPVGPGRISGKLLKPNKFRLRPPSGAGMHRASLSIDLGLPGSPCLPAEDDVPLNRRIAVSQ